MGGLDPGGDGRSELSGGCVLEVEPKGTAD